MGTKIILSTLSQNRLFDLNWTLKGTKDFRQKENKLCLVLIRIEIYKMTSNSATFEILKEVFKDWGQEKVATISLTDTKQILLDAKLVDS